MISTTDIYLIAASSWIFIGNIWHAVLLTIRKGRNRPPTISEHAVEEKRLLRVHRIIHTLPMLLFPPLALFVLIPQKYYVAATALLFAAIFDWLQALTLNNQTAPLEDRLNIHSATTWLMALSYFVYSASISLVANVSIWIYGSALLLCILLIIFAVMNMLQKHLLVMQMSYFVLLSCLGLLAHSVLILK